MAEKTKFSAVSDEAVRKATGKSWEQWFSLLDKAGAKDLPHREIAKLLHVKHLDSGWWSQMVTVMYERSRGLRELHQKADGFAASISKTFNVSLDQLYAAWKDASTRADWLAEQGFEVTRATVNKSMRLLWNDGKERVEVNFYPKGSGKTQLTIDHSKLDSAAAVTETKNHWRGALARLQEKLSKYG